MKRRWSTEKQSLVPRYSSKGTSQSQPRRQRLTPVEPWRYRPLGNSEIYGSGGKDQDGECCRETDIPRETVQIEERLQAVQCGRILLRLGPAMEEEAAARLGDGGNRGRTR
jgi:hypothetical protein